MNDAEARAAKRRVLWLMVPVMIVAIIARLFIWMVTQPGSFF